MQPSKALGAQFNSDKLHLGVHEFFSVHLNSFLRKLSFFIEAGV